jgi:predicted AAA+ superfamily ATPase
VLEAAPAVIADDPRPVLIDEHQRVPAVWDEVKRLVDADGRGGQFLLTGSEPVSGSHSGAGRITTIRLRPLTLVERGIGAPTVSLGQLIEGGRPAIGGRSDVDLGTYADEIIAGGFPGLRHLTDRALSRALDGYISRIVERDLPEAGYSIRHPAAVQSWLRAYGAATATTTTWETIRDAATGGVAEKPARNTTRVYTELLTSLRILDPIEAWVPANNLFKRLGGAPKHHLCDPALAARLLGRTRAHLLEGKEGDLPVPREGTLFGGLFESLCALSIRVFAEAAEASVFHLRTDAGRQEVDFIVERADGGVVGVEVKLAGTVDGHDVRHLRWLEEQLGDRLRDAVVLNSGPEAYRREDGIAVVPLALLGP